MELSWVQEKEWCMVRGVPVANDDYFTNLSRFSPVYLEKCYCLASANKNLEIQFEQGKEMVLATENSKWKIIKRREKVLLFKKVYEINIVQ